MPEMMQDRIALDRASVRMIDQDGHMHIAVAPISKANICGYYGREIPDGERLGLEPNRIYQLLRDPAELGKSAASFNGKPLLIVHKPQTAEDHDRELTVGSVNNVRWEAPYLKAELVIWDGDAIEAIESGAQRQLSSAYRYDALMQPGELDGKRFDGRMVNIRGNHVAIVSEGRAGPDVVIGDSALPPSPQTQEILMAKANVSRQALLASGAIRAYLHPKLAADAKVDLGPVLKGVTGKNWKAEKPKVVERVTAATKGKLAADATLEDFANFIDQLEDVIDDAPDTSEVTATADPDSTATDDDGATVDRLKAALKAKGMSDEEIDALCKGVDAGATAMDNPPPAPPKKPEVTKAAMDAAISSARTAATNDARAQMRAIQMAEREVRPIVGELALDEKIDTAADVYKLALDCLKVDVAGVPKEGYGALVRAYAALPKPAEVRTTASVAMDAAAADARAKRFPNANRLLSH